MFKAQDEMPAFFLNHNGIKKELKSAEHVSNNYQNGSKMAPGDAPGPAWLPPGIGSNVGTPQNATVSAPGPPRMHPGGPF